MCDFGTSIPLGTPTLIYARPSSRNVYVSVASAFGVSKAIEGTHVAESLGRLFISASSYIGGKVSRAHLFRRRLSFVGWESSSDQPKHAQMKLSRLLFRAEYFQWAYAFVCCKAVSCFSLCTMCTMQGIALAEVVRSVDLQCI
eukprot:1161125-Pelagomonas_calceolata.AAC.10